MTTMLVGFIVGVLTFATLALVILVGLIVRDFIDGLMD